MARRRKERGRALNGVLLLDKPKGLSSNAALQQVKRLFGAAKAGHTGSLDPLATGMLPICFGEATKFSQFMLDADKVYRARGLLGIRTASGDTDSEIISQKGVPDFSAEDIDAVVQQFLGASEQVPSMYSALKYNGQPLYKLARQGIEIERKARPILISRIELLDFDGKEFEIELHCSKGTYVRSLIDDIGEKLGCGAHVIELHRISVDGFDATEMHTMEELENLVEQRAADSALSTLENLLLPVAATVDGLPEVELNDLLAHYIKQGQAVFVPNTKVEGQVALLNREASDENKFLGVGEMLDDGRIAPRRLVMTG